MLIQDVEKQTGLDRATIRFYEKEKIITPQREENGYRSYQDEDVQTLLKVKLLRQLGVGLSKIKLLQQGSGDFSAILSEQIRILDQQIRNDTHSSLVCRKIQDDGAEYNTLDSLYYLNMLAKPSVSVWQYSEPVAQERHPWRRYFARWLDYKIILVCLQLLLVVIIRIRPFGEGALRILNYFSLFAAVPILAVMLHYFGTTPGKWMVGIRLESIRGGKLSGGEALDREGKLVWHAMGLFIPILHLWKIYHGYRNETQGVPQVWNEDTEIIYTQWTALKKTIAIITALVTILLSVYVGSDVIMPTYKHRDLSLSEFAENYNDYEKLLRGQGEYVMDDDGLWKPYGYANSGQMITYTPYEEQRPDFIYDLDKFGAIRSIYYEKSSENVDFEEILPYYCKYAIETLIASRPGSNYRDIIALQEELDEKLYTILPFVHGSGEGETTIRDVKLSWKFEVDNCSLVSDGVMFAPNNETMFFGIQLWITVNE